MSELNPDIKKIVQANIGAAAKMLNENSEFFPYAVGMGQDGNFSTHTGEGLGAEFPPAEAVISFLNGELKNAAAAGVYKATAVFSNVSINHPRTKSPIKAVRAAVDHQDGSTVTIYVAYMLEAGKAEFGESFTQPGEGLMFASDG